MALDVTHRAQVANGSSLCRLEPLYCKTVKTPAELENT